MKQANDGFHFRGTSSTDDPLAAQEDTQEPNVTCAVSDALMHSYQPPTAPRITFALQLDRHTYWKADMTKHNCMEK